MKTVSGLTFNPDSPSDGPAVFHSKDVVIVLGAMLPKDAALKKRLYKMTAAHLKAAQLSTEAPRVYEHMVRFIANMILNKEHAYQHDLSYQQKLQDLGIEPHTLAQIARYGVNTATALRAGFPKLAANVDAQAQRFLYSVNAHYRYEEERHKKKADTQANTAAFAATRQDLTVKKPQLQKGKPFAMTSRDLVTMLGLLNSTTCPTIRQAANDEAAATALTKKIPAIYGDAFCHALKLEELNASDHAFWQNVKAMDKPEIFKCATALSLKKVITHIRRNDLVIDDTQDDFFISYPHSLVGAQVRDSLHNSIQKAQRANRKSKAQPAPN